ncbi:MAG: hypothetical protein M1837_006093 [Sclerophora amabilis]|nr:MAG: hypothetical protein M1837_006093 [Sclerophora amabilis]
MKIILTGASGFIGGGVLDQCIQDPAITSIVVLSRRELPASKTSNDKVKVIIQEDFLTYPDSLLQQLRGAKACIWYPRRTYSLINIFDTARPTDIRSRCIGSVYLYGKDETQQYIKTNVDYTLAAAKAYVTHLVPQLDGGESFRFVFCSGMLSVTDQKKSVWIFDLSRKVKGQNENELFQIAEEEPKFDVYSVRPGGVTPVQRRIIDKIVSPIFPTIRLDELGVAMVKICKSGSEKHVIENSELIAMAQ